ncbi:MAG: hypothetical protein GC158_06055 [Cyanobacteria bacterium RI_101]|nr:hypothetical protein [Cyanobacteria bacterium RI_101]
MTRFYSLIPSLCGALAGLTLLPLVASANTPAPSLDDGIICVAKGKVEQGQRLYLYTSVIDDDSVKKKEPVTVTINQLMATVEMDELVVLDPENETLTVIDSVTGTPPEMRSAGLATTIYQGNNTFAGKTAAGTPVSFTLSKDYRSFQVQHAGQTLKGSCH